MRLPTTPAAPGAFKHTAARLPQPLRARRWHPAQGTAMTTAAELIAVATSQLGYVETGGLVPRRVWPVPRRGQAMSLFSLGAKFQKRSLLYPESDPFSIPPPGSLGQLSAAGVLVNADTAMTIPVVLRAVTLLADSVSALPLKAYAMNADGGRQQLSPGPAVVLNPFTNASRLEGIPQLVYSLVLRGNAYMAVLSRDTAGRPDQLTVLNPDAIRIIQADDGTISYYFGQKLVPDIVHIKGPVRTAGPEGRLDHRERSERDGADPRRLELRRFPVLQGAR